MSTGALTFPINFHLSVAMCYCVSGPVNRRYVYCEKPWFLCFLGSVCL